MKNKCTPDIRFAGFTGNWECCNLGGISTKIGSGKTPKGGSENYKSEGIPLLRSQNIFNNKVNFNDVVYITSEIDEDMANSRVQKGDVLLNITGASIGRSAVYKLDYKANVNQHVAIIRPLKEVNPYFIQLNITSEKGQKQIELNQAGGGREGLNFQQIAKLAFYFPSLVEQDKIKDFFMQLDNTITLQQQELTIFKQTKKGFLKKIFAQEIRFRDDDGKEFPNWEKAELSKVLSIPKKEIENSVSRNKLLTVKLHRNGVQINQNTDTLKIGSTNYYRRKAGQFIYGKQNFFNGAFDIIPDKYDGYLSSGDVPTLDINEEKVLPLYLLYYLGREDFYKKTESVASGTGSKRIHESTLLGINISLPTMKEQTKIGKFFKYLDDIITLHQGELDALKEMKKAFLQKMFV
ncbi:MULTISPECIES: restriction endonuclease subunit S [Bacillus cereus group]|uniref:restriction endonuclease subunit S n=1 Tax=Bacillus cereus group TaxID=86661 RepID=UPI002E24A2BA|nr:restriction endonuclease subunit S [Bacillus paranthracis]MED1683421.1 restriction endonuclease subunit S [Bacillus paranthracis]